MHDPFVQEYKGDVMDALRGAECAVLMVAHNAYRDLDLKAAGAVMKTRAMVDARGFFETGPLSAAGFSYRVIGVGTRSTSPPK